MAREATLSVSLTTQLKGFVRAKVQSGQYQSASEVIRESLRAMQADEAREKSYWADVRRKVRTAKSAADRGETTDGKRFMARKIAELRSRVAPDSTTRPSRSRKGSTR